MARTVLFFGDSNTRGYGVMPEQRFAAVVEATLAATTAMRWRFAVASAASDFRGLRGRLDNALERYTPDVLVWQCPTGPASYFPRYPRWVAGLKRAQDVFLSWRASRYIAAEIRADPARLRTRYDALRDGRYVDAVYRHQLANLPGVHQLRQRAIKRHGVTVKATRERYLELMSSFRDHVRGRIRGPILFLGLLPASDTVYPGYSGRVANWSGPLASLLHHPEQDCRYLDLFEALTALPHNRVWLSDGTHMTVEAHRCAAAVISPVLGALMEACESTSAPSTLPA